MYETDRLILRKAEFRDWEAMYRNVWSHPEAAGYTRKSLAAPLNCTPFVRQYDILSNKRGVLLCQKEYQTNDIRRSSREWL